MHWGIDLSSHKILSPALWDEMVDNGLAFVIVRAAQGYYDGVVNGFKDRLLDQHVKDARDRNLPIALFQWVDPNLDSHKQADYFSTLVDQVEPKSIWADLEQYWKSWEQWSRKYVNHENITLDALAPATISLAYSKYLDILLPRYASHLVVGNYSGPGFANSFLTRTFVHDYLQANPYWNAAYIKYSDADGVCTWPEFQALLAGRLADPSVGIKPRDVDHVDIWQFSDHIPFATLPNLDMDLIRDDGCYKLFFGDSLQPREPKPDDVSNSGILVAQANGIRIRLEPSLDGKIVGQLMGGDLVHPSSTNPVQTGNIIWQEHTVWSARTINGVDVLKSR